MSAYNDSWEKALDYEVTPVAQETDPALLEALQRALSSERLAHPEKKEKELTPVEVMQAQAQAIDAMRRVAALEEAKGSDMEMAGYEEAITTNALKLTAYHQRQQANGAHVSADTRSMYDTAAQKGVR